MKTTENHQKASSDRKSWLTTYIALLTHMFHLNFKRMAGFHLHNFTSFFPIVSQKVSDIINQYPASMSKTVDRDIDALDCKLL